MVHPAQKQAVEAYLKEPPDETKKQAIAATKEHGARCQGNKWGAAPPHRKRCATLDAFANYVLDAFKQGASKAVRKRNAGHNPKNNRKMVRGVVQR